MGTVQQLRETLRLAALREPRRRFHQLFDKLYRPDVLHLAFERACHGGGRPPGYDRARLSGEGERLRSGSWRPQGDGFGDRVVEEAAALVLEPVLLPGRRFDAWGLVDTLGEWLGRCRGSVLHLEVRPDWAGCPGGVLGLLERRIADRRLLALVRAFLAAGLRPAVLDFGLLHVPRLTGGLGPLLGEYHLAEAERGLAAGLNGPEVMVRGGNEMVLAGGGRTGRGLDGWRDALAGLGLVAVEPRVADPGRDGFDFLGFHWRKAQGSGKVIFWPARTSVQAVRDRVREITRGGTHLSLGVMVARVNEPLAEWGAYYRICPRRNIMRKLDHYVRERLAVFNVKKHGLSGPGLARREVLPGALRELGLIELGKLPQAPVERF